MSENQILLWKLELAAKNLPKIVSPLALWLVLWKLEYCRSRRHGSAQRAPLSFQRGNDDNVCRRYDADDYGADGMALFASYATSLSPLPSPPFASPLVPRQPSQSSPIPLLLLYRAGLRNHSTVLDLD